MPGRDELLAMANKPSKDRTPAEQRLLAEAAANRVSGVANALHETARQEKAGTKK